MALEDGSMPGAVGVGPGTRQRMVDPHRLHRVLRAELPLQVAAVHEPGQPRMEGSDVVVLQVHLDEGLPVVSALMDLGGVVDVAVERQFPTHAEPRQILRHVAAAGRSLEQQTVPGLNGVVA